MNRFLTNNILADAIWLGLGVADWIVLAIYFVVIMAIGIWSISKVKDMSDFFMGGRRFGKIFMMFFAFGAGTSSDQAISVVAGTWRTGLAGIWWQFLWLWATPFYWIVAPVMRRMRALTTADFFESRFNTPTSVLYTIYGIVISVVFIAGGLFGSGKMVDALTGGELNVVAQKLNWQFPEVKYEVTAKDKDVKDAPKVWSAGWRPVKGFEYAILAMIVMFVLYGMAGGLGAAIITDLIQGILTIAFSFLLLPFIFFKIGGFGMLHKQADIKENLLSLVADPSVAASLGKDPITIFYVLMLAFVALTGIVVQPHIMGVCGAGKSEYEGRFGFTVGNFLKRFCTVAWTFTGLACVVWYLGTSSPMLHLDQPLTKNTGAAYAELSADEQKENDTAFKILPEKDQKKITSDRDVYTNVLQVRNNKTDYDKLTKEEQEKIDKADKEFADRLFGKAAYDILPMIAPGLIGLLLASLLAAVMSTSDAQMIISSGLFTENIYKRFIGKNQSQRHYLWVGRFAGLIIVLLALALQTTFTDVIHALKVIIQTPAAIGISFWFGISWRRWNAYSVWVSTFVTLFCMWLFSQGTPIGEHNTVWTNIYDWGLFPTSMFKENQKDAIYVMASTWKMLFFMSAGIGSGIIVSFLTPKQADYKLNHFFTLMHTPVVLGEVVHGTCQLPENPGPPAPKMFPNSANIEIPAPTKMDIVGFGLACVGVAAIIGMTMLLAKYV